MGVVLLTGNTLSKVPDGNILFSHLIDYRDNMVNSTYYECCEVLAPPYKNSSVVKDICKWPSMSKTVEKECQESGYHGTTTSLSVYNCVCDKDVAWYGKNLGDFFAERFLWVGGAIPHWYNLLLCPLLQTRAPIQSNQMEGPQL